MPRLTEQEQQEIIRFIETGKPLPDKYRFLLFDDKREVELVWNGKTSEVCNIVLPFQVIEQVDEPRTEKPEKPELQTELFSMDARGRQLNCNKISFRKPLRGKINKSNKTNWLCRLHALSFKGGIFDRTKS
jgi:hypothetical protein